MQGQTKHRWEELCELASKEQDAEKLLALIEEINRLLALKYNRVTDRPFK